MKLYKAISRGSVKNLLLIAVLSRIFVFLVAVASNAVVGVNPACRLCGDIGVPFFNLFSRWDSSYYADIAVRGYSGDINQRWEFFPLYPILMGVFGRLLAIVAGIPLTLGVNLAGFAVSNLAFLGSVYYLHEFSKRILSKPELAFDSAVFLCIYPAGVFFSAVYSESLFLLLTVASLYYWWLGARAKSATLSFLATLARPVGIFLAVPYLYETLKNPSLRRLLSAYLPAATALLGYLVFAAFSQIMTGTPFANLEAERKFWNVTTNPYTITFLAQKVISDHPIIIPFLALSIVALAASILQARSSTERAIDAHAIFLLTSYLVSPIISFPRYSNTLLPTYWSLSRWTQKPWIRILLYSVFLVLLAVGTALFVNWYSFY
jgi:Gpi18-like mannosyltransferase